MTKQNYSLEEVHHPTILIFPNPFTLQQRNKEHPLDDQLAACESKLVVHEHYPVTFHVMTHVALTQIQNLQIFHHGIFISQQLFERQQLPLLQRQQQ